MSHAALPYDLRHVRHGTGPPSGPLYLCMRVYSPSQTSNWLRCPIYRELSSVRKLRPRVLQKRDLAAILGTAMAAGCGAHHLRVKNGAPADPKGCGEIAREMAKAHMRQAEARGQAPASYDGAQYAAIPDRAYMGTLRYVEQYPVQWEVLDVERTFDAYGRCRIDLIADDGYGAAVIDVKTKLTLDDRYKQKEIDRYKTHWNMLHYHWTLAHSGEFPRLSPYYYIVFVVLEPKFRTWVQEYVVHPETLETWETSARRVWKLMEASDASRPLDAICPCVLEKERKDGRPALTADPSCPACGGSGMICEEVAPWMVAEHSDQFGLCEFHNICFEYHFDQQAIARYFVTEEDT